MSAPELLSPAGDWECLRAAVANGANAVYFGLPKFNARMRAHNFTLEELPAVMDYLHERDVRGYITFNTLIFTDELVEAAAQLEAIAAAGADAIIVQDLGLVRLAQHLVPRLDSDDDHVTGRSGVDAANGNYESRSRSRIISG
jgi:putative protease